MAETRTMLDSLLRCPQCKSADVIKINEDDIVNHQCQQCGAAFTRETRGSEPGPCQSEFRDEDKNLHRCGLLVGHSGAHDSHPHDSHVGMLWKDAAAVKAGSEPSQGAQRAGQEISKRFRKALPNLPDTTANTLALIIDAETRTTILLDENETLRSSVQSLSDSILVYESERTALLEAAETFRVFAYKAETATCLRCPECHAQASSFEKVVHDAGCEVGEAERAIRKAEGEKGGKL